MSEESPYGRLVESYWIPDTEDHNAAARVSIFDNETFGKYVVELPPLSSEEAMALGLLKKNLRDSIPAEVAGNLNQIIDKYMKETAEKIGLIEKVKKSYSKFHYYLTKDFGGFWEIDPLMADDGIEEISVTRWDRPIRVVHRRHTEYMFMETNISYESEERVQAFVRRLANFGGTNISIAQPSLEVVLHGPSDRRITATLGDEITRPGSTFTVRKQRESPLTILQLASPEPIRRASGGQQAPMAKLSYHEDTSAKSLTALMAAYFWLLLEKTTTLMICGETSSGKTTLMNAILAMMNPRAKIVTAEDVLEINLPESFHWERMKTRVSRAGMTPTGGRYEYSLSDLLKLGLRFSPTILSLGEMRGEESETVAAAITLGFSTITTLHAEDAQKCVQRVMTAPMKFAIGHVRDITAIVTMRKIELPDKRIVRRVLSVDEIKPVEADEYEIVNIFKYNYKTDSFSPSTPEEVIGRSFRLRQIAESFGWSEASALRNLTNRANYILEAVKSKEFSVDGLSRMVVRYITKEGLGELQRDTG